ncbi:P-loop containing nucleoside triphosphate hydrolase protein [Russula brevipes]|nr:P-loop containing nucleoside triphosphate hydrolase protein [Russula brevipes]
MIDPQTDTDHASRAIGLSDPQYAARRKRMFEFLTRMRAIGADVDIDIPAIAVIGWQSAGKSSLIEAISGITLPRASGTCTRCPTECQLTHSDSPWACRVVLRLTNPADGSTYEVPFGSTITEKSEVTERIRRAQRTILSPSVPRDNFLSGAESDLPPSEKSFSPNCIVLQISGPDITDLNFIDLPGLFVGGDETEMQLIRDLAISYMKRPSCIILLTVACETDFVNQGAHRLAQEYDPSGERTIGVLTKPDRIPPTEEENWLPLVRGEKEDTTLWFCVKCPSSQAISEGVTWEDARGAESRFFSHTHPWSTLEGESKGRLGTGNLTRHLSEKLCDLIAERLPSIQQELSKLLEITRLELRDLPQPPSSNPLREILGMVKDFTQEVEEQVEGVPERGGLLQQIRPKQDEFRGAIRRTAPCFVPRYKRDTPDEPVRLGSPVESEELCSPPEFEGLCTVPHESVGLFSGAPREHVRPFPPDEPVDLLPPDEPVRLFPVPDSGQEKWEPHQRFLFLQGEEDYEEIGWNNERETFIDDVLERAEWAVTRELPNNYPFVVQRRYIIDFVDHWDDPARMLFDFTVKKLKKMILRVVDSDNHFGRYAHSNLKQRVVNTVLMHIDQRVNEASNHLELLLKVEKEPSTKNARQFKDYRGKFFTFYKGIYNSAVNRDFIERLQRRIRTSTEFDRALEMVILSLSRIGIRDVKPLDLAVLRASEDSDDALKIMADVRAYFQVAYKRFVDNVPKVIDEGLVLASAKGLYDALITALGVDSPDAHEKCARWLAEPQRIAEKREKLVVKEKRLLAAEEELLGVFD